MNKLLKNYFALTDKGVEDLKKASFLSFLSYIINIAPAILLMLFAEQTIEGKIKSNLTYLFLSIGILILMWILLNKEYVAHFDNTYKESGNLRIEIADIISKLPLSYFSKYNLSDLSQTIMSDVEKIEHSLSHSIPKILGFIIFFPIISFMLLLGNFKLGLTIIFIVLLSLSLIVLSKNFQIKNTTRYYNILRENSEAFQEAIELHQEIKSYGLTDKIKNQLFRKMEESEKIHMQTELLQAFPSFLSLSVLQFMQGAIILVGTILYINSEISLIYFIGYLLAGTRIKGLIDMINLNLMEIFFLDARVKRINDLRETKLQEGNNIEISSYDIELENVSFSYNKEENILKDVSFLAKQGEVTALVGISGCGKTSILKLVSRLYDYDRGTIKIGDKDIKKISTKNLFEKISIVFQDVILFNNSILENIRLGRPDATDEEVLKAAELANCNDFIKKMPNSYNTLIGENGATLSGGERQRLSIARAFLKNAPIILLDEISASIDVENEKKIQESLNKLLKNKTALIISHRLKSIENVDKIVVINDGKVEAVGKHKDLLKKSQTYLNLIEKSLLSENFKY